MAWHVSRATALAFAAAALLVFPSGALGASGSITNIHADGDGTVSATYTTNMDICTKSGYCGWFPHAYQVPAAEGCRVDDSHIAYVGDNRSTSGSQTQTDPFYPAYSGPIRLCLYAYQSGTNHFIAEAVYTPAGAGTTPTPTPTPAPTPTPTPTPTPPTSSGPTSASITNIRRTSSSEFAATYRVTYGRCSSTGDCSWWPFAWQVSSSDSCSDDEDETTWVGEDHTGAATETARETFEPLWRRTRLCLGVYQAGETRLVAQKVFTATTVSEAPTTATAPSVYSMTRARAAVRRALALRFGVSFTAGSGFQRSCKRRTRVRVRCSVSWSFGSSSYRGTVTVWVHSTSSTHTHYSIRIVRRRPA